MNILFVAATAFEIAPLLSELEPFSAPVKEGLYQKNTHRIQVCITGVGTVATAYSVGKALHTGSFDLAIQAGIAGTFRDNMPIGSVWQIRNEYLADLGAETKEGVFMDLFEMGLQGENDAPFKGKKLTATPLPFQMHPNIPLTDAITVNTVSGNQNTVIQRKEKYHAALESMEGAAFHYTCLLEGVHFLQLRSVSNQVAVRDKSQWDIPLAIAELNKVLIKILNNLPLS